jgi:predicted ATPase
VQQGGSQFIISTHSPLVLAYPDARIYHLGADGIERVEYEQTDQVALIRDFLANRERYLRRLFSDRS